MKYGFNILTASVPSLSLAQEKAQMNRKLQWRNIILLAAGAVFC